MQNTILSRVYCGKESFEPNENDVVLWNGVIYQVLTRAKVAGWYSCPLKLSKTKANLLIRKGVLKTDEEFSKRQKAERRMISNDLTFYYFDMEKFKEMTTC